MFEPMDLALEQLELNGRGSWRARLDTGAVIELGAGSRGPLTEKIQSAFFDIVNGKNPKYAHWLTLV
jgi:hypothetical protein